MRRIGSANIEPEVSGSPDGIVGIFDRDAVGRIVLAIQESGDAEDPVAVGASGIAAEFDGEQLERLFLTLKVEAIDPPEHLVFAGRCREDRRRRWDGIGGPERSEPGVAIRVDIYI